jgi:hypothetical protein
MPVTEFERPTDYIDALASVRRLPDAEAEQRQLRTVREVCSLRSAATAPVITFPY